MKKLSSNKNNRWIQVTIYFFLTLSVGLAASGLASLFIPETKIDLPSSDGEGVRATLAIGACFAMLLCPILAAIKSWDLLNFLIASVFTLGILLGNIGFGIVFSIVSVMIYLFALKIKQFIIYIRLSP